MSKSLLPERYRAHSKNICALLLWQLQKYFVKSGEIRKNPV